MKFPLQARPCTIPIKYYSYWFDYGRCIACKHEIRHEIHLYNHYRKYHWLYKTTIRYYVWYNMLQDWVEISREAYIGFKRQKQQPTAMAREYFK